MTIAASTACGKLRKRGIKAATVINTIVAATSDETWLLAPAQSLTAVDDTLQPLTNPPRQAAARLETPSAISSWFASISYPYLLLRLYPSPRASERMNKVIAKAPGRRASTSSTFALGRPTAGNPG